MEPSQPSLPAYVGRNQPGRSPVYVRAAAAAVEPFDEVVRRFTPDRAEDLVASARRKTGLDDLGPGEVIEPLQVLMDTVRDDPKASALGRLAWTKILRDLLTSRLRIVDYVRRHPEVHDVEIRKPLIILGLPRTGTTLLYYLLSSHPGARPLMGWESFDPVPPAPGRPDRRRRAYERWVWGIDKAVPALKQIHELDPSEPDEGIELMDRTFLSLNFMLYAYPYIEYLLDVPDERFREAWELFYWQLQMLQMQHMRDFWVLKAPGYLGALDALAKWLPDARYVLPHRDLRQALPSAMSLVTVVGTSLRRPGYQPGLPRFVERFVDRLEYARSELASRPCAQVLYPELVSDPAKVARRIFEELEYPVPGDLDARVEAVVRSHPQHKNGRHRYRIEQFGFSPDDVEAVAAAYDAEVGLDRLDIPSSEDIEYP